MKFLENFEELGKTTVSVNFNETLNKFVQNFKHILKKNEDFYGNLWETERIFMKHKSISEYIWENFRKIAKNLIKIMKKFDKI